jgi:hypothetical protein
MNSKTICYVCNLPETSNNKFAMNPLPCDCKGTNMIHIDCIKDICGKYYDKKYVNKLNIEYNNSPSDLDIKDACSIQ